LQHARSDPTAPAWVAAFALAVVIVVCAVLIYGRTAAIAGLPLCLAAIVRLVQAITGRRVDHGDG